MTEPVEDVVRRLLKVWNFRADNLAVRALNAQRRGDKVQECVLGIELQAVREGIAEIEGRLAELAGEPTTIVEPSTKG